MAVGDVVSGIGAANSILDFQPAAGVECLISQIITQVGVNGFVLYDGVTQSFPQNGSFSGTLATDQSHIATKVFINNSIYLRILALGVGNSGAYSGIQIK